eukprot:TRINITY_DN739_c0_g1_i1.p1 TRINITY_DN739_c0_g1~~TRINITY_DN739_c0_g1_i1.p1  ORF type:complete len:302 (+),score=31.64 TRINITY_DN739_c0_g1_i1:36-941(+)
MTTKKSPYPSWWVWPLSFGGGATGWLVVHPMDLLKVRMQLEGETGKGLGAITRSIFREEGITGFYRGLTPALARQLVYATARLGLYDVIRDMMVKEGEPITFFTRAFSGVVSGGLAACLSCPTEVSLVRMQADGRLAAAERRNYRHVGDALLRIAREEGVATYWRGCTPTVIRAMVVGLTQVGCYDQFKSMYLSTGYFTEGVPLHLTASVTAGLVYSLASMPFDQAKTRMQNQKPNPDGTLPFRSTGHTILRICKEQGVLRLWKGFVPYYARCGGHTIAMFIALEQYKAMLTKFYADAEKK